MTESFPVMAQPSSNSLSSSYTHWLTSSSFTLSSGMTEPFSALESLHHVFCGQIMDTGEADRGKGPELIRRSETPAQRALMSRWRTCYLSNKRVIRAALSVVLGGRSADLHHP